MLVVDTTQATAANRVKYYVNGVQVTAFATTDYPTQNSATTINSAVAHNIAAYTSSTQFFDGYMAEVNFIDGQALAPTAFGTVNSYGVWQPITYGGSYGNNGFRLPFTNNASTTTLGYDFSPQGNNWTTNNISVTAGSTYDSMTDVPTLTSATAANFATLNPLMTNGATSFANGNLNAAINTSGNSCVSTIAATSGKFYFEAFTAGSAPQIAIGISPNAGVAVGTANVHYFSLDGKVYVNNTATATGATWTNAEIIGVAFEVGGNASFYKNNTLQGTVTMPAGTNWIAEAYQAATQANTVTFNFGQQPFTYTPPSGFVALNTFNL
jgi:hypothetical protein